MVTAMADVTEVGSADDERRPLMTSRNIAWMNLGFFGVQFSFGGQGRSPHDDPSRGRPTAQNPPSAWAWFTGVPGCGGGPRGNVPELLHSGPVPHQTWQWAATLGAP